MSPWIPSLDKGVARRYIWVSLQRGGAWRMEVHRGLFGGAQVRVSEPEVGAFMRRFPCSGLVETEIEFIFESNGSLVDVELSNGMDSAGVDGPGLLALSQDAHAEARRQGAAV